MKKFSAVFLSVLLLITLYGCTEAETPDKTDTDIAENPSVSETPDDTVINEQGDSVNSDSPGSEQTEQDEAEPFQIPDNLHLDSKYSVVDGKLIYLTQFPQGGGTEERAAEIDNAVCVMTNRFVLCSDGTVVDLYGSWISEGYYIEDFSETDIAPSLVAGLYTNCGIRDITYNEAGFILYAGDGYCYSFYDPPASSYKRVEDPHIESDGSVFSEKYPELSTWKDIVELQGEYDDQNKQRVFIGLTSSGKVLSYGIDFTPENVVKIQVCYIPMDFVVGALTADGRLVFSEVPEPENDGIGSPYGISLYDAVQQAIEFTDVEDFRITSFNKDDVIILVKKKDGTLHATTNNYYNPGLVQSS